MNSFSFIWNFLLVFLKEQSNLKCHVFTSKQFLSSQELFSNKHSDFSHQLNKYFYELKFDEMKSKEKIAKIRPLKLRKSVSNSEMRHFKEEEQHNSIHLADEGLIRMRMKAQKESKARRFSEPLFDI